MSQASIVMPKESSVLGIAMKADVDPALAAISTLNAGDTDPGTGPGAHALWADTESNKLKQRNADNTAWNILCDLGTALAALTGNSSQTFNVANASENSQAINLGQLNDVISSIKNLIAAANPAGTIIASGRTAAPDGYLLCDGSSVSRTAYAALFSAIGTAFGAGDGATTFALPDLRGIVLRGVDGSRGFDAGRELGSYQIDAIASHNVSVAIVDPGHQHYENSNDNGPDIKKRVGIAAAAISAQLNSVVKTETSKTGITATGQYTGASETRMKNVAVNYFIKA